MALEFLKKLKEKLLGAKSADKPKTDGAKKSPRVSRSQGGRVTRAHKSSPAKEGDATGRSARGTKDQDAFRRPRRNSDGSSRGNHSPRGSRDGRPRNSRSDRTDSSRRSSRDGFSRRRERDEQERAHVLEHAESENEPLEALPAQPAEPWDPSVFQVEPQEGKKRFHDFDLPDEIMHAIYDLGFKYCTPIQSASLANALAGQNVAGRAQTGTGKTAAYLVAILTRYMRSPDKRNGAPATPRALVIAPTRELCVQICRDAQDLGRYTGLRSLAVFGGMDYAKQQRQLNAGPVDLVAATPGRLLDFQRSRVIDLSHVDTLVIDEADRMLDMGFIPDVTRIIRRLPAEGRQTLLYSATLDDEVMRLASRWMPDPVKVEIEPEHTTAETIEQRVYIVTSDQKFTSLCHLLEKKQGQRVLIFANRRSSTERLAERLRRYGFDCELLSGDVNQNHRMRVLDDFRAGKTTIVVATDVAGRGLDIADLDLVVNFELPYEAEDYVHRIGRTGRAGHVGVAVSFADDDESFVIPDIEKFMGEEMKCTLPEDELLEPLPRPARRERSDGRRGGRGERSPRGERRPRKDRFAAEDQAKEASATAEKAAEAPVAEAASDGISAKEVKSEAVPEQPVQESAAKEAADETEPEQAAPVAEVKAEAVPEQPAQEPATEKTPAEVESKQVVSAAEVKTETVPEQPAEKKAPVTEAAPIAVEQPVALAEESHAVSEKASEPAPEAPKANKGFDSVPPVSEEAPKAEEKPAAEAVPEKKSGFDSLPPLKEKVPAAESKPVSGEVVAVEKPAEKEESDSSEKPERPHRGGRRPRGERAPRGGERRPRGEKQGEEKPARAPRGERGPKQPRGERGGRRSNGGKRASDKAAQPPRSAQPRTFRAVVVPPGTHAQVWSPGE